MVAATDTLAAKEEDKMIAIKKVDQTFEHSTFAKRMLRELKILRLLNHENIIKIKHLILPKEKDYEDLFTYY